MGRVHMKVAAVLHFIDAVTEQPVRYKGLQVRTAQQNRMIWKDTDCAVILEQDGAVHIDVMISGKFYQEIQQHIELMPDRTPRECSIWLLPSGYYPFCEDMTIIRGTCFREELYVLWPADSAKYKLTETTSVGSDSISLWGISGSVDGRMFFLCDEENGDSSKMELVTLIGRAEQGTHTYRTKECVQHVFYRGKTKLYKAAKVYTDDRGSFFTAFQRREMQKDGKILFWCGGEVAAVLPIGEEREYFVTISNEKKKMYYERLDQI